MELGKTSGGSAGNDISELLYYASIIESTDDAIIGKTLDGNITSWNPGAERIFGYTSVEAIGRSIYMLVPPDRYEEEKEILARVSRGERTQHYETVRVRKDGTKVDISVSVSPIIDSSGMIIGASKIARDITERRKTREEYQKLQVKHLSILDQLMEGCQIIDFDWRYIYVNEVAAIQGRHSRQELLGRTMMDVYPGIENSPLFSSLRSCMASRMPAHMENQFTYEDGLSGWFYLNIEPVSDGLFILSVDITQERRMREELDKHREHLEELVEDRTAQLEEVNRELEAFSYSVSHDLRAPLRHIDGFVDLLRNSSADSIDAVGKRYLDVISSSAREMGKLIDELLVFSRMGRTEMRRAPVDMDLLMKEVIAALSADTAGREIHWSIQTLPRILGDASMLRLVLVNLVSNAVKYSSKRTTAEIVVRHAAEDSEDVFSISDNGAGFDMKYVDKLFGVFQRLHHADEFEGVGIGLANVKRIVKRHGGKVWAEGKVGEGSTFYFTIPRNNGHHGT